jgi:hypothetical protein
VIQIVPGFLAKRLSPLVIVGNLGGINAHGSDSELGLVTGKCRDGIPVADALDLGDEGVRGGGVGGIKKEDKRADGNGKRSAAYNQ